MGRTKSTQSEYLSLFTEKKAILREFVRKDPFLEEILGDYKPGTLFMDNVIFLSLTDGTFRAKVFIACGRDFDEIFETAANLAESYVEQNKIKVLWLKADFINSCTIKSYRSFCDDIKSSREFYLKQGIAFDTGFSTALLEAQLNCGGMINYKKDELNLPALREYYSENGISFMNIPKDIISFTTAGYICDEDNSTHKLYIDDENYGRRICSKLTAQQLHFIIEKSSHFLSNAIDENGRFDYGINPVNGYHFESYNILRHTGTIWSILMQYETTRDKKLIPKIDKAIEYMMQSVEYYDKNHAYLIERKASEIKLGGNAVAVITLCTYMNVFKTDKYISQVEALANSILGMQEKDGSFYHVLSYPDFSRKEKDRIVYYDGEAAFALAKAYSMTKNESCLKAAKKALDYFESNDYTRFCDHWIAYAVNEVTIYDSSEKYLNFGLKNANKNLSKMYNQDTTFHTFLELLMAAFSLYQRINEKHLTASYLNKFNLESFIKTIYKRAHYMLNGFLYPEIAMYMKNPLEVVNTFCVRHDSYRIRIDDVQHYIGGYYNFLKNFDKLEEYYEKLISTPVTYKKEFTADSERASFVNWILKNI